MKIIKKGTPESEKPIKDNCSKCKTVFKYLQSDIQPDNRDGDYAVCPVCGAFIAAKVAIRKLF